MNMAAPYSRRFIIGLSCIALILTAASTAAAKNFGAAIADVSGPVFVITKDTNNIVDATKGQRLVPGDAVTTGPEGEAEILYDDGNLTRLDENSRLLIEKLAIVEGGARETGLRLELGRAKNAVSKLGNKRSHFEVHTASAVAGVTGTPDWVVALTGDAGSPATEVDLLGKLGEPGEVYCEGAGGAGRQAITSGMRTVVQPGMPPATPFAIDPERLQSLLQKMAIKTPNDVRDLLRNELDKISGVTPSASGAGIGSGIGSAVGAALGAAGTAAGAMAGAEAAKAAAGAAAAGAAGSVIGSVAGAAGGLVGGGKKDEDEKPAVTPAPVKEKETQNTHVEKAAGKTTAPRAWIAGSKPLQAGEAHSVFLNNDGTVFAWGNHEAGQPDDAAKNSRLLRMKVKGPEGKENLEEIVAVAAGGLHTVAVKKDGTVWAWGNNEKGQLGDGSTEPGKTPVQVKTSDSKENLDGIVAVAAGGLHTIALKKDGTVWAWGYNDDGQLGDNSYNKRRLSATQVKGPDGDDELEGIIAVAAGKAHSLALKKDGTVWAWGLNDNRQLGDNSTSTRKAPVQVKGLKGIIAIAAGGSHSLALKNDGTFWTWGNNEDGQLGDNSTSAKKSLVLLSGLKGVQAIAAGENHSAVLKNDGTVWVWGSNSFGQLGNGSKGGKRLIPTLVEGLSGISAIGTGSNHMLALKNDGTLWAWGSNNTGQLGDNSKVDRLTPVLVNNP